MRILSGIQPSGRLHIGNELGAVRNWLDLQADPANECFFFIADWHSLTEQYDVERKAEQIRELVAELIALGIDPERSTLFRQSDIPEHMELAWYFSCVTPISELQRMTQYKDKTARGETTNMGLFSYPVLMSADILAYAHGQPVGVPVGEDQRQHVELANSVRRWFNNRYGEMFNEVRTLHTPTPRLMSLKDPTCKMSKSHGDAHCLFLDDTPEVVEKKLKSAVTDSGEGDSAGVTTLMAILDAYAADTAAAFKAQHGAGTLKYSELKPAVASVFSDAHADFRARKNELMAQPDIMDEILAASAEKIHATIAPMIEDVRRRVGIRS
ncbi:MAG: tryptophan--tRNA ligase [Candidatus Uhrbacteria bacterium]